MSYFLFAQFSIYMLEFHLQTLWHLSILNVYMYLTRDYITCMYIVCMCVCEKERKSISLGTLSFSLLIWTICFLDLLHICHPESSFHLRILLTYLLFPGSYIFIILGSLHFRKTYPCQRDFKITMIPITWYTYLCVGTHRELLVGNRIWQVW